MKQFRFFVVGCAPTSRKHYLPVQCQSLPHIFSMRDVKPGMFSASIMKRLRAAQDGTRIIIRRWRGHVEVGVSVIDKDARQTKRKNKNVRMQTIKKRLRKLLKNKEVQSCLLNLRKLAKIMGVRTWEINTLVESV